MLGIDITPNAVYLLALSNQKSQYCIDSYAKIQLPDYAVEAGHIHDLDAVVQAVQRAVVESKALSKSVVLAVPNPFTMSKTIQISANMSERDLDACVRLDMGKHISEPHSIFYFDYHILGLSAQNRGLLDVLVVASRGEHVNQRVEVMRRAGLSASIVEVESHSHERATHFFSSIMPTDVRNPFSQMVVSYTVGRAQIEQDASCLMVAFGLALRGL